MSGCGAARRGVVAILLACAEPAVAVPVTTPVRPVVLAGRSCQADVYAALVALRRDLLTIAEMATANEPQHSAAEIQRVLTLLQSVDDVIERCEP